MFGVYAPTPTEIDTLEQELVARDTSARQELAYAVESAAIR